ncbi:sec14p-like phosphatidylinositol transfer family protein isoform X2 [Wolffia australiana]
MALRLSQALCLVCSTSSSFSISRSRRIPTVVRCSSDAQMNGSIDARKLVLEVKEKLHKEYPHLPKGKNGSDDEEMILWFLRDRKFSVDDAIFKLEKAIRWREEFGVSELTEESVRRLYETGKAYVHEFLDVEGRAVLVVDASKHFPGEEDSRENEKLCVFLIERALSLLPEDESKILTIIDLRGFRVENGDVSFLRFLPVWQLVRPWLKSYASLVRFCNAESVKKEYFTEATVPARFLG